MLKCIRQLPMGRVTIRIQVQAIESSLSAAASEDFRQQKPSQNHEKTSKASEMTGENHLCVMQKSMIQVLLFISLVAFQSFPHLSSYPFPQTPGAFLSHPLHHIAHVFLHHRRLDGPGRWNRNCSHGSEGRGWRRRGRGQGGGAGRLMPRKATVDEGLQQRLAGFSGRL